MNSGVPSDRDRTNGEPITWATVAIGIAAVVGLALLYWVLSKSGLLAIISNRAALRAAIEKLGLWGPLALVGLEALAIVLSPIPSAPVAIAAGAIYGPVWGAVLIVIGAEAGAIIAFLIARGLGYEAIRRWSGAQKYLARLWQ